MRTDRGTDKQTDMEKLTDALLQLLFVNVLKSRLRVKTDSTASKQNSLLNSTSCIRQTLLCKSEEIGIRIL
jgi:hypothetical protein